MGSIKRQVVLVLLYIVVVFGLERLDIGAPGTFNLHPFAYVLIVLAMILTIIIPQLRRASIYLLIPLWGASILYCGRSSWVNLLLSRLTSCRLRSSSLFS